MSWSYNFVAELIRKNATKLKMHNDTKWFLKEKLWNIFFGNALFSHELILKPKINWNEKRHFFVSKSFLWFAALMTDVQVVV